MVSKLPRDLMLSMAFGDAVSVQLDVAAPDGHEFNGNTITATIEPVAQVRALPLLDELN